MADSDRSVKGTLDLDTDETRRGLEKSAQALRDMADEADRLEQSGAASLRGVADATNDARDGLARSEQALRDMADGSDDVQRAGTRAMRDIGDEADDTATAIRRTADTTDDVASASGRATKQVTDDTEKQRRGWRDVNDEVGDLGDVMGKLGPAAAGVWAASQVDSRAAATGRLAAQVGGLEGDMAGLGDVAEDVYGNNFGDNNLVEVGNLTAAMKQSLGDIHDDELQALVEDTFAFSDAWESVDPERVAVALGKVKAAYPDADQRAILDGIVESYQRHGPLADDLLDTLQEYPGQFAEAGVQVDDMFRILNAGIEAGIRDTDYMADTVKEFGNTILDTESDAVPAMENLLGTDRVETMIDAYRRGEGSASDMFETIIVALGKVEDPMERNALLTEIMGTRAEDIRPSLEQLATALEAQPGFLDQAAGSSEELGAQYDNLRSKAAGLWRQVQNGIFGDVADVAGDGVEIGASLGMVATGLSTIGVDVTKVKGGLKNFSWGELSRGQRIAAGATAVAGGIALATTAIAAFQDERDRGRTLPSLEDMLAGGSDAAFDSALGGIDGVNDALSSMLSQDWESKAARSLGFFDSFGGAETAFGRAKADIGAMEQAILSMLDAGDQDNAGRAFQILVDGAEASGASVDDLMGLLPNLDSRLGALGITADELAGPLAGTADGADDVAVNLDQMLREMVNAEQPTRNLKGSTQDVTVEFRDLETAAASVDDAVNDLTSAYRDLTGGKRDVRAATSDWEASLESLTDTVMKDTGEVDKNGDAIRERNTTLDLSTQAGRDNEAAIRDSQVAAEDHAIAVLEETGSIDEANKVLDQHRDDLYDAMVQAGYSEEAARTYTAEIERIPDDAKTKAEFDRAAAREALGKWVAQIEDTPDYTETYGRFFPDRSALESWLSDLADLNKTYISRGEFRSSGGPTAYAEGTDWHPGGPARINDDPRRGIVGEVIELPTGAAVTTSAASVDLVTDGVVRALESSGSRGRGIRDVIFQGVGDIRDPDRLVFGMRDKLAYLN